MTRDEFMEIVYDELASDSDNSRANRIIEAFDDVLEWMVRNEEMPIKREWVGEEVFRSALNQKSTKQIPLSNAYKGEKNDKVDTK